MNGQQLQIPTYQQISGAVQLPLVMLVWCALLLFFGYQYQANALLPQNDERGASAPDAQALLRVQQRNDRLLAEIAAQTPVELPELLDREDFGQDLAAALAGSTLGSGDWQPQQKIVKLSPRPGPRPSPSPDKPSESSARVSEMVGVSKPAMQKTAPQIASKTTKKKTNKTASKTANRENKAVNKKANTKDQVAAKFVRLPATVNPVMKTHADPLRASKDRARKDLQAGRIGSAYQYLRGKVAQGRTDIEYLGLLALASLQQHPDEAEVIYRHLMQLQPDAERWRQGLQHSQRLLAMRSGAEPNTNLSSASNMQSASVSG